MSPLKQQHQHRGPDGSLECEAPEDRDLRLACVRRRVVRDRQRASACRRSTRTTRTSARPARPTTSSATPASSWTSRGEYVLVQSTTKTAADPAFRAVVNDAIAKLETYPKVTKLRSPLAGGQRGPDLRRRPRGPDPVQPQGRLRRGHRLHRHDRRRHRHGAGGESRLHVVEAGSASTGKALDAMFNSQLARAGMISIPITLVILLLVFGSLVGAAIPLGLALTAVFATMGLVALPSQIVPMDESISEVILLIGLAVGVDYSLFYIRRERDERRAGRSETAALEAAAATSGRAVLISGITVMIAMAGMFFSGDKTFMSFAIGTMMVVAVAMIGSLTVLPAMLSRLGDRVDKVRVPFLCRLKRDERREPRLGCDPRRRPPPPARLGDRRRRRCSSPWRSRRSACTRASPASTRCRSR